METIAAELGADLAVITDGVDRTGMLGYFNAAITSMRKRLPDILSVKTPKAHPRIRHDHPRRAYLGGNRLPAGQSVSETLCTAASREGVLCRHTHGG